MKILPVILLFLFGVSVQIIAQDWDKIYKECEGLRVVIKDKKYGYIDKSGKVKIPVKYDKVGHFKGGIASVKENGKWKFIDKEQNIIYDKYNKEAEGMRLVIKNNKYGFIDELRKLIVPLIYEKAYDYKNGYAIVQKNGKRGYVNKSGELVVAAIYEKCFNFSEGYATVQKDGKQGFINTSGKVVVPIKYDKVYAFSDGKATVVLNGKKGKTDAYGKVDWGMQIGSFYKGGVVIELDESGKHGLICAIEDCGRGKEIDFVDAQAAAGNYGRYSGWRIPTLKQLRLMYKYKDMIEEVSEANGGGAFGRNRYWSSTDGSHSHEKKVILRSSSTTTAPIDDYCSVRVVKEF